MNFGSKFMNFGSKNIEPIFINSFSKKNYGHKINKVKINWDHNFSFQCGKDFFQIWKRVFKNGQK
jgi:RecA-family ATPase